MRGIEQPFGVFEYPDLISKPVGFADFRMDQFNFPLLEGQQFLTLRDSGCAPSQALQFIPELPDAIVQGGNGASERFDAGCPVDQHELGRGVQQ